MAKRSSEEILFQLSQGDMTYVGHISDSSVSRVKKTLKNAGAKEEPDDNAAEGYKKSFFSRMFSSSTPTFKVEALDVSGKEDEEEDNVDGCVEDIGTYDEGYNDLGEEEWGEPEVDEYDEQPVTLNKKKRKGWW